MGLLHAVALHCLGDTSSPSLNTLRSDDQYFWHSTETSCSRIPEPREESLWDEEGKRRKCSVIKRLQCRSEEVAEDGDWLRSLRGFGCEPDPGAWTHLVLLLS